jgi:hypothetical protein
MLKKRMPVIYNQKRFEEVLDFCIVTVDSYMWKRYLHHMKHAFCYVDLEEKYVLLKALKVSDFLFNIVDPLTKNRLTRFTNISLLH